MGLNKLNNLNVTPPGGWGYEVKEPYKRFSGYTTRDGLRVDLGRYCSLHNLPIPNDDMIQEYICQRLGRDALDWCVDEAGQQQHAYTGNGGCRLTLSQVISATGTIAQWMAKGMKRVEGFEAERRATICSSCPENQEIKGCTGCAMPALKEMINRVVSGGSTTKDGALQGCCQCGCSLKALVWMPLEQLHSHLNESDNARLPDHCWKKKLALPQAI
jgi:hypothetical protein